MLFEFPHVFSQSDRPCDHQAEGNAKDDADDDDETFYSECEQSSLYL